jgi:hypothetical protein
MSEEELLKLEDKNNLIFCQLISITSPIPQTPRPTQVEDVETIIVHDPGKTIRFTLDRNKQNKGRTNWQKKKARRDHTTMRERAEELIISDQKIKKMSKNGKEKSNEYKRQQL